MVGTQVIPEVILSGGMAIHHRFFSPATLAVLRDHLTFRVEPKGYGQQATMLKHYAQHGPYVVVPRAYGIRKFLYKSEKHGFQVLAGSESIIEDRRTCPNREFKFYGDLRSEQYPIVWQVCAELKKHEGAILGAVPGAGKTTMALWIAHALSTPFLVLVDTNHLLDQWVERIEQFLQIKPSEVGVVGNGRCEWKPITIAMVQSMMRSDHHRQTHQFGLVIMDEVHVMGAPVFSQAIRGLLPRYRLGLSGTATRKDGLTGIITAHVGQIVAKAVGLQMTPRVEIIRLPSDVPENRCLFKPGRMSIHKVCKVICNDSIRNNRIIEVIMRERKDPTSKIIVLSHRRSHVSALEKRLTDVYGVKYKDVAVFTGLSGHSVAKKRMMAKSRPIILATWQYAAKGLDLPDLTCLVMATPQVDIEQAVGRILRPVEGKKQPLLVDFADTCAMTAARRRMSHYKRRRWNIGGDAVQEETGLPFEFI